MRKTEEEREERDITMVIELHLRHIPFDMVRAGLHCDRRISRHMLPFELMFGWYIFVVNAIWGGVNAQND